MHDQRLKLLISLARAYYEQGLTQEQIASGMSISRSQVSRYLTEAREAGIVQFRVIDPTARNEDVKEQLLRRFPRLQVGIVAQAFSDDPAVVRHTIGVACADYLRKVVHSGDCISIGCGRTIRAAINSLKTQPIPNLSVVQAMGSLGHEVLDIDFNELTRAAAAAFAARPYYVNAPAIVGAGTAEELEAANISIRESLERARQASIFLVGIGSIASDQLYVRAGLITQTDIDWLKAHHVAGDICARFLDANGNECIAPFTQRIVGVTLQDIRRARLSIGVATGSDKALPLRAALRGGWINAVITDELTAQAILRLDAELSGGESISN